MVQLARRLFTVDEYYRMAAAGILNEDDRVELIEGEIVEMPPIGNNHAAVVDNLVGLLTLIGRDRVIVRVQGPVRIGDGSAPQPDAALLRLTPERYKSESPGPADILLVIEVADTTLRSDRSVKLPLYAGAGIQEYWIVNLEAGQVEVYRAPSRDGYLEERFAGRGDSVSPLAFPGVNLAVDDILG